MASREQQVGAGAASGAATGTAIMPGWGTAIGAVAGGALAYISAASQAESDKERQEMLERAAAEFRAIPDPETKAVVYEKLQQSGMLTPAVEKTFLAPASELSNVSTDPRLKQAQMAALSQLAQLGEGGMDVKDLADIERAKQQYRGEQAAQQAAVQESMARRGLASSGMEQIARQQTAQTAANQMNQYEQQIQGEARRRALEAIMQQGSLAGNIRTQNFSEEARKAEAADAIARFNAQMQSGTESRNVAAANQAQAANIARQQAVNDYNAQIAAKQAQAANALAQNKFQNQYQRVAGAQGTPLQGQIGILGQQADRDTAMYSGLAQAGGQAASAYANKQNAAEQRKWQEGQNQLNRDAYARSQPAQNTPYQPVEEEDSWSWDTYPRR